MLRGVNLPRVGNYNTNVVLSAVRASHRTSRVEIAQQTGLTAQTASVIVRSLIDRGIVEESGSLPSEGGKPRKMLCIKPSAANAVGIHFDPLRVSIVMVDMMGNLLSSSYQDVAPDVDPEKVIAGAAKEVLSNLNKLCIPRERVLGVGAARTGPIDQRQGLAASTRRDLWAGVPIERLIAEHSGFDVVIDNDANAAAVGERWFGHGRTTSDFALLYLSNGIGAGLFLANHFYRGASLKAGELAHIVVEPNGAPCHCGNRGCLEAVCSPSAIVRATHNELAAGRPSKLAILYERDPALVDHTAVCLAAVDRDPLARALIDRVAQYLADCAVTIANMLGLEFLIVGGPGIKHVAEIYVDKIGESLRSRPLAANTHAPQVVMSETAKDGAALGAAAMVLHETFAPNAADLTRSSETVNTREKASVSPVRASLVPVRDGEKM